MIGGSKGDFSFYIQDGGLFLRSEVNATLVVVLSAEFQACCPDQHLDQVGSRVVWNGSRRAATLAVETLPFADDTIVFSSSALNLQLSVGRVRTSTSESEASSLLGWSRDTSALTDGCIRIVGVCRQPEDSHELWNKAASVLHTEDRKTTPSASNESTMAF